MATIVEAESKLTDRYQTTVPEVVRRSLNLGKRDKIHYVIRPNGEVVLTRAAEDADPVIGRFLSFLAEDMAAHPDRLRAVDTGLVQHLQSLTEGADIDLDAPLSDDDE